MFSQPNSPSSFALTKKERQHYDEHGYVILRSVLGRNDLAPLQNDLKAPTSPSS